MTSRRVLAGGRRGVGRDRHDVPLVDGEAGVPVGALPADAAVRGHHVGLVERAAQRQDAARAALDHVRGGEPRSLLVREPHVVEVVGHVALPQEHDRLRRPHAAQLLRVEPGHGEQDAVVELEPRDADRLHLVLGAGARPFQDEVAPLGLDQRRDLVRDLAEVVVEAGHDERDGVGPARPAGAGRSGSPRTRAPRTAARTRARVGAPTGRRSLRTFDTVMTETPASRATSDIVTIGILLRGLCQAGDPARPRPS